MCWKSETMLRDLPVGQALLLTRGGRVILQTSPHDLMQQGRMSGTLCLDQIAWAFHADDIRAAADGL